MDELERWIEANVTGRRARVVGVGNRLRGDDGAGPAVVDRLRASGHTSVLDAGTVPENFLGELDAGRHDVVLFVDALEQGAAPGTCSVVPPEALGDRDGGTHAPTLRLLAGWLADAGTRCWLLGVQPGGVRWGESLSPPVARAADAIAAALDTALAREVSHA